MLANTIEIEGTWEQIVAQAPRYTQHKMRLVILPERTEDVAVSVPDNRTLEEKFEAILSQVPAEEWDKLPIDLGDNLDHYLYGTPKRS